MVRETMASAFEQAAPLAGWELPKAFTTLQRTPVEGRPTRIRSSSPVARKLRNGGGPCCGEDGSPNGCDQLRCSEASGAVPGRTAATEARSGCLSVPATGHGGDDISGQLHVPDSRCPDMTEAPQILLNHQLKKLKLPTILREYDMQARLCAAERRDHVQFLARLIELELIDRERRMIERRIKAARFPARKSLDSFDFAGIAIRLSRGHGACPNVSRVCAGNARPRPCCGAIEPGYQEHPRWRRLLAKANAFDP